jgi:ATP-binding cassette subfamily F protein 3
MVSRGGVEPFDGDLDDYQKYLLDEAKRMRELAKEEQSKAAKLEAKAAAAKPPAKPVLSDAQRKAKKELAQVESRMEVLNGEGAALEGKLGTNPHPQEIAEMGKSLKKVNDELKTLEEQWLELTAAVEG